MTDRRMTPERVKELIASYGGDPAAWPEEESEAASEVLKTAPELFSDILLEARFLDSALASVPVPDYHPALVDRIMRAAAKSEGHRPSGSVRWRLEILVFPLGMRWPAGAALASFIMGLAGGYAYAGSHADPSEAENAYIYAFGAFETPDWLIEEGY